MTGYSNIVAAFDGSSGSVEALKAAEMMAKNHQAHLTVVYVDNTGIDKQLTGTTPAGNTHLLQSQMSIEQAPMPMETPLSTNNHHDANGYSDIANRVMDQAKNIVSGQLEAEYEILVGKPDSEITRLAEEKNADVIVIGNRGFSGMKKLIKGSVSDKVTNQAACSVFVVK